MADHLFIIGEDIPEHSSRSFWNVNCFKSIFLRRSST
jgi:hypothetical protein